MTVFWIIMLVITVGLILSGLAIANRLPEELPAQTPEEQSPEEHSAGSSPSPQSGESASAQSHPEPATPPAAEAVATATAVGPDAQERDAAATLRSHGALLETDADGHVIAARLSDVKWIRGESTHGGCANDHSLSLCSRLPKLADLEIFGGAAVTDAGIEHLTRLSQLRRVVLAGCPRLTEWSLRYLGKIASLRELQILSSPQISDGALDFLSGCPSLQRLDLCYTSVTAAGPSRLSGALRRCSITRRPTLPEMSSLYLFRRWRSGG